MTTIECGFRRLVTLAVLGLAPILAPAPTAAATIAVDTTDSTIDAAGTCTDAVNTIEVTDLPGPDGLISLPEAICAANNNAGPDVIELEPVVYTLTEPHNWWYGPTGLPPIYSEIVIEGNGAVIERDADAEKFRLFYIAGSLHPVLVPENAGDPKLPVSPGDLTLRDLTLRNGLARGGHGGPGGGGGAGLGGAVYNQGGLTLERVTATGNVAEGGKSRKFPAPGLFGWEEGFGGGGGLGGDGLSGGGGFRGDGTSFGELGTQASFGGEGGDFLGGDGGEFTLNPNFSAPGRSDIGGNGNRGGGGFVADGGGPNGSDNVPAVDGGGGGYEPFEGQLFRISVVVADASGAFGGGGASALGAGGVGGGGGAGGDGGFGGGGGDSGGRGTGFGGFGGGGGSAASGGFGAGGDRGGGAGMGGVVFNHFGHVELVNTTLSGNTAIGGDSEVTEGGGGGAGLGGALFNLNGMVTATSSTLVENTAEGGVGPGFDGSGKGGAIFNHFQDDGVGNSILNVTTATVTLKNSILAYSTAEDDCHDRVGGALLLEGVNVIETDSLSDSCGIGAAYQFDPMLGTLADNGGPTETHLPLPGSPVIDITDDCASLATDQRGVARPSDSDGDDFAACEIGAVEVSRDGDGDGVQDDVDLCPDTALGMPVDANGCANLQVDADGDGVCDPGAPSVGPAACGGEDMCPATVIPESVPTRRLKLARWALVDDDTRFDTASGGRSGRWSSGGFDTAKTAGCSCEQIIDVLHLGRIPSRYGCSTKIMALWSHPQVRNLLLRWTNNWGW